MTSRVGRTSGVLTRCRPLCLAAALTSFFIPSSARAQSHAERLNVYARALSTTTFAEQACLGYRTNAQKLDLVRTQAGITNAEDQTVADRIRESTAAVTKAFERTGQDAWCAETYRLFGPDGTLVKGVLGKKQ
jgi:hypothetical protein